MRNNFLTAQDAFEYYYDYISGWGKPFDKTNTVFNVGFTIAKPTENLINTEFRKWSHEYAEAEWQWYLSGDRDIYKLGKLYGKVPEIWNFMADELGNVNSNYGYQWDRGFQLDKVVAKLQDNQETRQAVISIYDGKDSIYNNKLNMCVTMRSNDLWYGFCNDQYCFSQLQKMIAERLSIDVGEYHHFAHNMHIYWRDLGKKPKEEESFLQRRSNHYK
jgi:thymidylate synthase